MLYAQGRKELNQLTHGNTPKFVATPLVSLSVRYQTTFLLASQESNIPYILIFNNDLFMKCHSHV